MDSIYACKHLRANILLRREYQIFLISKGMCYEFFHNPMHIFFLIMQI